MVTQGFRFTQGHISAAEAVAVTWMLEKQGALIWRCEFKISVGLTVYG
jgi:hypothetical protein